MWFNMKSYMNENWHKTVYFCDIWNRNLYDSLVQNQYKTDWFLIRFRANELDIVKKYS